MRQVIAGRFPSAGALKPGRWRWLRALTWGVVLAALPIGGALVLTMLTRRFHLLPNGPAGFLRNAIYAAITLGIYWGAVRFGERRPVRELAPEAALPDLAAGLAGGIALFALVFAGLVLLGGYTLRSGGAGFPWQPLAIALASGVLEELVFRGVVFRIAWMLLGLWPALALSSALFGLAHLLNPQHSWAGALAIIFEAGLLLGGCYVLTRRLYLGIGLHVGWNFAQGGIFGAEVSGIGFGQSIWQAHPVPGAPSWLTGGNFGPEATAPAILADGLAGGLLLAVALLRGVPREP